MNAKDLQSQIRYHKAQSLYERLFPRVPASQIEFDQCFLNVFDNWLAGKISLEVFTIMCGMFESDPFFHQSVYADSILLGVEIQYYLSQGNDREVHDRIESLKNLNLNYQR